MANLIIGNGEDLRALVDSLFTPAGPGEGGGPVRGGAGGPSPETGRGDPASLKLPSVWAATLDRHTRYGVK